MNNIKLLVCVISDVEKLEDILQKLERNSITGATIIQSKGMAMALENYFDGSFLGSLRAVLEPGREENSTIFMAIKEDKIPTAVKLIEEVIGDFGNPNTGIIFSVPIDFIKGISS